MLKLEHNIRSLNVHFHFGPHGKKAHAQSLVRVIEEQKPHIYIPEITVPEKLAREEERAIERGQLSEFFKSHHFREFVEEEGKIVSRAKLAVKILETIMNVVGAEERIKDIRVLRTRAVSLFFGKFDESLRVGKSYFENEADWYRIRGKKILDGLKDFQNSLVPKALDKNFSLRRLEELKALVRLGDDHIDLFFELLGLNLPDVHVTASTAEGIPITEYVSSISAELISKLRSNSLKLDLENPQHREFMARALLERVIKQKFLKSDFVMDNSYMLGVCLKVISNSFSLPELEQLCSAKKEKALDALEVALKAKGLRFPHTIEDVNFILSQSTYAKQFGL